MPHAGGHDELVELLLAHGANIEHRDKKGCTSLILAASAGHALTVAILLDHSANIEAQSDRTKDTALSLACTGGRQEVMYVSQIIIRECTCTLVFFASVESQYTWLEVGASTFNKKVVFLAPCALVKFL